MPFGEGGYRTSFWPTDREMRRSVFDFHFPKFQNLETARGLVYNFFQISGGVAKGLFRSAFWALGCRLFCGEKASQRCLAF